MKIHSIIRERGTVLIIALLTITIMTLICATSLLVTSQNANSGMQVASWQQALTGAETGVDAAIRALNTGSWTLVNSSGTTVHWMNVGTGTLPSTEPAGGTGSNAVGAPTSGQYNYLPSSALTVTFPGTSEGPTKVSAWVTVDTGGMSTAQDTNGKQWYRLRSTGKAILTDANGNALAMATRVSNNRMDDDLRNTFSLRFDRKTGLATNTPGPTRTIEVIMEPLAASGWARGITLKNWISLSGGSTVIDSYNSGNNSKSTNHLYDATKRQSHGDIATLNTGGNSSDFRSTYVYGNVTYSGTAPKNTNNVQGTISTPFSVSVPATSDPSGLGATWTTYGGGGSNPPNSGQFLALHTGTTTYIKVTGDLVISSSGNPLHLVQHDSSGTENVIVWVTGKLTTQGSGYIQQDSNINVTWYVGGDITVSGGSYQNNTGYPSMNSVIGYGTNNKLTISGGSDFLGTYNVPGYDATISGGGSLAGAIIANTLTESGGSGLHYDEALGNGGASTTVGNYAFASWFEDNSDPKRKDSSSNYIVY